MASLHVVPASGRRRGRTAASAAGDDRGRPGPLRAFAYGPRACAHGFLVDLGAGWLHGGVGLASLLGDSATQAFTPRLVPRSLLTQAHARIDQSAAVAQTSGPALAGGLVSVISAPMAVFVDAVSYLFSAVMLAGIHLEESNPVEAARASLVQEVRAGLSYVYGHRTLAPLAVGTHGWFICNGAAGAMFVPFVLNTLHLSAIAVGLALSAAGAGGLVGSLVATRLGRRFGAGRTMVGCQLLTGLAFATVAASPTNWLAWAFIGLGQSDTGRRSPQTRCRGG